MITLNNFSENNRDKIMGNSLYRICKNEGTNKWYIHEIFNDGSSWAGNSAYYNDNLKTVIDIFNKIKNEKEIISMLYK